MPYKDIIKQKLAQHESYLRNKDKVLLNSKKRINHLKELLRRYKRRQGCKDCGITNPVILDFHHIGDDKDAPLSRMIRTSSKQRIKNEIGKCEVLCANCHRIHHHNERGI